MFRAVLLLLLAAFQPAVAAAETLRVATYSAELLRDGPGLLLRDVLEGDPQADAVAGIVGHVSPDILLVTGLDWDLDGRALAALAERFAEAGAEYPHLFAARPNAGLSTSHDLDGDGRVGDPRDAQGYGRFTGHGGMALLSRYPIRADGVRDFTPLLWRDLPGAGLPETDGAPFPSEEAQAVQRLSTTGHWDVPVVLPSGREIRVWAFHATPPVFDGPEDLNGLRNRDETALWLRYLDGDLDTAPAEAPFVLMGDANLDPVDGEGRNEALQALLSHPRLQDPAPRSAGAIAAAERQGGSNLAHGGDPALDTADWDDDGPGNMRVDYVLPSDAFEVLDAGVFWPAPGTPEADLLQSADTPASRHHLVWVDLSFPDPDS